MPVENYCILYSGKEANIDFNIPANIYMLKVNNRDTRERCKVYSKLTIKTPEKHISHFFLVYLLLTYRCEPLMH